MCEEGKMEPTKYCFKKVKRLGESKRGGELVQSILHASMGLSQKSPLVLVMYANKDK
jgi:hypothetical protein